MELVYMPHLEMRWQRVKIPDAKTCVSPWKFEPSLPDRNAIPAQTC